MHQTSEHNGFCFAETFVRIALQQNSSRGKCMFQLKFLISSRIIFVITVNKPKSRQRG